MGQITKIEFDGIEIKNIGVNHDNMCLTGSTYFPPTIPEKFYCRECSEDRRTKAILEEGWKPDSIVLLQKIGSRHIANRVHFSGRLSSQQIAYARTRYPYSSLNSEEFPVSVAQCTTEQSAIATCYRYSDDQRCIFLFDN